MATPESEGRTLISATGVESFVGLYGELQHEFGTTVRALRASLMAEELAAFKASNGEKEPEGKELAVLTKKANGRLNVPEQYALAVPDDIGTRTVLLGQLAEMFAKTLRATGGDSLKDEDLSSITKALAAITPKPESPEFPTMLRLRVEVGAGLIRGGFVEAMATLVRTLASTKSPQDAIKAAKEFARPVPNKEGGRSVLSDMDAKTYADVTGKRIVRLDDRANVPNLTVGNIATHERMYTLFGEDFGEELDRVFEAFHKNADRLSTEVETYGVLRDPQYIRVQWCSALMANILKLDPNGDESTRAALTRLAADLSAETTVNGFVQAFKLGQDKKAGA